MTSLFSLLSTNSIVPLTTVPDLKKKTLYLSEENNFKCTSLCHAVPFHYEQIILMSEKKNISKVVKVTNNNKCIYKQIVVLF